MFSHTTPTVCRCSKYSAHKACSHKSQRGIWHLGSTLMRLGDNTAPYWTSARAQSHSVYFKSWRRKSQRKDLPVDVKEIYYSAERSSEINGTVLMQCPRYICSQRNQSLGIFLQCIQMNCNSIIEILIFSNAKIKIQFSSFSKLDMLYCFKSQRSKLCQACGLVHSLHKNWISHCNMGWNCSDKLWWIKISFVDGHPHMTLWDWAMGLFKAVWSSMSISCWSISVNNFSLLSFIHLSDLQHYFTAEDRWFNYSCFDLNICCFSDLPTKSLFHAQSTIHNSQHTIHVTNRP